MSKSANLNATNADDSSEDDIWGYTSIKRKKISNRLSLTQSQSHQKTPIIAHSRSQSHSQSRGKTSKGKSGEPRRSKQHTARARHVDAKEKATEKDDAALKVNGCLQENEPKYSKPTISNGLATSRSSTTTPLKASSPVSSERPTDEVYCPCCQMPFLTATPESRRSHVSECLDLPFVNLQECPQGVNCKNVIPSHYRKFQHQDIAQSRARSQYTSHNSLLQQQHDLRSASFEAPPVSEIKEKAGIIQGTTSTATSPYSKKSPNLSTARIDEECEPQDGVTGFTSMKECEEGQTYGKAKRSLFDDFENEQTFHIFNKVDAGTLSSMEMDSLVEKSPGADSDSDIFDDKETAEDLGEPKKLPLKPNSVLSSFGKQCPKVSDMIANALVGEKDEDSLKNDLLSTLHFPVAEPGDMSDSSQSLVCTGTSSTKENSFSLTPLCTPLTPISPNQTPSKLEFLRRLTPKPSQKQSREKTPVKKTSSSQSGQTTPKGKSSQKYSHKKSTGIEKTPRNSQNQKTPTKPKGSDIAGSKKQSSMLSFLKSKTVPEDEKNLDIDRNEPKTGDNSETNNKHDKFSTEKKNLISCDVRVDDVPCNVDISNSHAANDNDSVSVSSLDLFLPEQGSTDNTDSSKLDFSKFAHDSGRSINNKQETASAAVKLSRSPTLNSASSSSALGTRDAHHPWALQKHATSNPLPSTLHGRNSEKSTGKTNNLSYGNPTTSKRPCPFYKKIPDTPITVDAFRYGSIPGCKAYFLSHFHYDHYQGLTKQFRHLIYCSQVTANLVLKKIRVNKSILRPLTLNESHLVEGIEVILLEANHCPGSVLFLFKLPNGRNILHTGDFRANHQMELYPQLSGIHISQLYLDTTYCDPAYSFPPQLDVVQFAVDIATNFAYHKPNGLLVVGSYTIGKERIFQAIAKELDCKICVNREKKTILECLEDDDLEKRLTLKGEEARVHVLPMKSLNFKDLSAHLDKFKTCFDEVLAFEPTGWTHSKKSDVLENIKPKIKRERVTLYGVPYSEHSSYTEMKRFVQFLRPDKILPTVNNGSAQSRKKMETLFSDWLRNTPTPSAKPLKQTGLNKWFNSPSKDVTRV